MSSPLGSVDCHSDGVGIDSGRVSLSLGSPRAWLLTWFWKHMEKVVPQPVCSSKNLAAGVGDPDQVQGQGDLRVEEGLAEGCGAREAAPWTPCHVCLSVCLVRLEHRFWDPVALGNQVRPKSRTAFQGWEHLRGDQNGPGSGDNMRGPWEWPSHWP